MVRVRRLITNICSFFWFWVSVPIFLFKGLWIACLLTALFTGPSILLSACLLILLSSY
ncbi:hypothetical protein BZA77DRAFT_317040 [Pyronema omphalodes]|nr:hypothetical protein BZA77DRAFT_317040 [Pyronema omphalodes]